MKYAYKLIKENEEESGGGEESGLKGLKVKNELYLTAEGDLTADDLIKIINDPKNLEGVYTIESGGLKDLKLKVFGDRPNINATIKANTKIYQDNGKPFYTEIENVTNKKFDKKGAVIKKEKIKDENGKVVKDENGKDKERTIFVFPQLNKYNEELVEKYFNLTSDKQAKTSNLNYTKIDVYKLGDLKKAKSIIQKADSPNITKIIDLIEKAGEKGITLNKLAQNLNTTPSSLNSDIDLLIEQGVIIKETKTLKFPVGDETALKKILKKAGLTNKDYTLEKKEMNENLRETIKKLIHKSYGK